MSDDPDDSGQLPKLLSLGAELGRTGDHAAAERAFREGIRIAQGASGAFEGVFRTLLGGLQVSNHAELTDVTDSAALAAVLDNARRAVELCDQHDIGELKFDAQKNLAYVLMSHGRSGEALEQLARAEALAGTPTEISEVLMAKGRVLLREGDVRSAREVCAHAVEVLQQLDPGSPAHGLALSGLGAVLMLSDGIDTARSTLEAALAILKTHGLTIEAARVLHRLGRSDQALAFIETERGIGVSLLRSTLLFAQGEAAENADELDGAREAYEGALEEGRAAAAASTGAVLCLRALARVARRQGDMDAAIHHLWEAADLAEGLRVTERGDAPQRHMFAGLQAVYDELMDGLFERGTLNDSAAALWVIEASRARGLADELDRRRLRVPDAASTASEQALRARLGDPHTDRRAIEREIQLLHLQEVGDALPLARAPVMPDEIPTLLGERTLLLSYYVAPARSYGWAVLENTIWGGMIELTAARLFELVNAAVGPYRRGEAERQGTRRALTELAGVLLEHVSGDALEECERILIMPDGPLHQLPFELLTPVGSQEPLASRDIAYAPSMTALAVARARERRESSRRFFAIGDPAYRSGLKRLRHSGNEVRDIARLFGGEMPCDDEPVEEWAQRGVFLRHKATKRNVRLHSRTAQFVHFATHTLIDANSLYSALVLAPPEPDGIERGAEPDDLLQAQELLGMRLTADLVVCSACRTADGELVDGEGPLGFARTLMIAGARCAVVSLWPVDDEATARFMTRFYSHLTAGVPVARALSLARYDLRTGPEEWRDRRHWAGFVAVGDAW